MRYGVPYRGSKNTIAEWVVSNLPPSETLVDLFAGGCAVTHAAMMSGKFDRFVANDLTDAPQVFVDAINGEFDGHATVPTREEFLASDDYALRLMYSFGNNCKDYLWSKELEPIKVNATKMVLAPSVHERKQAYNKFMRLLGEYVRDGSTSDSSGHYSELLRLQGFERLERLRNLQGLQSLQRSQDLQRLQGLQSNLTTSCLDYRSVCIPKGATVYADPLYRNTNCEGYFDDNGFDFEKFDTWLSIVPFMVVVSEYTAPRDCVEVARKEKRVNMAANGKASNRIERLFVHQNFADEYRKRMGHVEVEDES